MLLVDARKGLSRQTRRHALLVSMLGIRRVVLAVNKMDLIGWSQDRFEAIVADFDGFARDLGFAEVAAIPLSAANGDNVVLPGAAADWYEGKPLLQYLEEVPTHEGEEAAPFRMAVQWVNRPNSDFPRLLGPDRLGPRFAGRRRRRTPLGPRHHGRADLHRRRRPARSGGRPVRHPGARRGDRRLARQRHRGRLRAARVADQIDVRLFWAGETPLEEGGARPSSPRSAP